MGKQLCHWLWFVPCLGVSACVPDA
jgi:hypothetical protein